jgi:hypothetical protein
MRLPGGDRGGPLERAVAVGRRPEADEKDPCGSLRNAVKMERLVARTAEVAPLERSGEGSVERLVEPGQVAVDLRVGGEGEHEEGDLQRMEVGVTERQRNRHGRHFEDAN